MDKIEEIERAVRPVLDQNRFELIETQYRREAGGWVLRLFIDKLPNNGSLTAGSVTLNDCGLVTGLVGAVLDETNVVDSNYILEVSSPGINRALKTEAHFLKAVGQNVKLSLHAPLKPDSLQRNFKGVLAGVRNGTLELEDATSGRVDIPLNAVAKANLDII